MNKNRLKMINYKFKIMPAKNKAVVEWYKLNFT